MSSRAASSLANTDGTPPRPPMDCRSLAVDRRWPLLSAPVTRRRSLFVASGVDDLMGIQH